MAEAKLSELGTDRSVASLGESLTFLESLRAPVAAPGLLRIERLLAALGAPHADLDVVHVTGTNGKGSVSRFIDAALTAVGLRTGRYTSPHLEDVRERITITGEPIAAGEFSRLVSLVEEVVDRWNDVDRPTHFEALTAVGLLAFAGAGLDAHVLEVGIGGRVDATNVAVGRVAVVTNVEFDHTELLGSTRVAIALEKAGIIKPGAVAVIGERDAGPRTAIVTHCAAVGATPWRLGAEIRIVDDVATAFGRRIDVATPYGVIAGIEVPMHGQHQALNAALAAAASEAFLDRRLDGTTLSDAWRDLVNPGRFEIIEGPPTVVIDVAHNPHGVRALVDTLEERFPGRPRIVVVGINPHKDAEVMLARLQEGTRALITTEVTNAPAIPARILGKLATELG
ncbi:MAG TPA: Mur ligase family protein, partial [Acidimicrobiales bacterium]|nr:Mur ligase family protein [Acidimicrobiales bacterium]